MKILIACEFSGIVREAFKQKGHDAWSCDLLDTEIPGQHMKCDVLKILSMGWDLMIAHPPCTRLTNSVTWYIKRHCLWNEVTRAAKFFNQLLKTGIPKICIENPVQHGYVRKQNDYNDELIEQYTQVIQPYQFGEDASKKTCLWLKGLPMLTPTEYIRPRIIRGKQIWGNQTPGGWNKLGPSDQRGHERSRTYKGIALAMANQWG